jgi:hypothetical protein
MYGKLINHGEALFEHKEDGSESYFITLLNRGEEKTYWSLGFQDAIIDANLQIGDLVSFKFIRKEIVLLKNGKKGHRSYFSAQKIEKTVAAQKATSQSAQSNTSNVTRNASATAYHSRVRTMSPNQRKQAYLGIYNIIVMLVILFAWIGFAVT